MAEDVGTVIRLLPSMEKRDEQNMHGSKKAKDGFEGGALATSGDLLEASYWDKLDYHGSMLMGGCSGGLEWKKEVELAAERTMGEYQERSCMPLRMEETRTVAMSKIRRLVRGQ
jgi:hypothetical protein